jgi:hypothetical protein
MEKPMPIKPRNYPRNIVRVSIVQLRQNPTAIVERSRVDLIKIFRIGRVERLIMRAGQAPAYLKLPGFMLRSRNVNRRIHISRVRITCAADGYKMQSGWTRQSCRRVERIVRKIMVRLDPIFTKMSLQELVDFDVFLSSLTPDQTFRFLMPFQCRS